MAYVEGVPLPTGKLPTMLLDSHVLQRKGMDRSEVLVPAAIGEDATVIDLGGDYCVASVDPITGATAHSGWLAIHVSCNDVAAHGARPVAALVTILLREGSTDAELDAIMAGAEKAAHEVGIQIAGGHTEVTPGLMQSIITATVIGRVARGRLVRSNQMRPGDHIWMSKTAGLEGTAIIAADFRRRLVGHIDGAVLDYAEKMAGAISVVPEALAAMDAGVTAMHDVTEGGVLGALWEMAAAADVGVEVFRRQIPVHPVTSQICSVLAVDPLKLISSGVLLAAAPAGVDLSAAGKKIGVEFTMIGRAVPREQGRWLLDDESRQPLQAPQGDELWRIIAMFKEDDLD